MKKSKDTKSQHSCNISKKISMTLKNSGVTEIIDSPPSVASRTGGRAVQTQDLSEESPYKNLSSEIDRVVGSDNDDFRTPKAFPKCPARKTHKTAKKRTYTRQMKLTRMIEKKFSQTDVNSEHLQMAVALSLSEQEEQPKMSIAETFDKFRFNGAKNSNVRNVLGNFNKSSNKSREKRKKSRFHYITPILLLRTQEDREMIITTKVSLILSKKPQEEQVDYEKSKLYSDSLQKYQNRQQLFRLNSLTVEELNGVSFLVANLNIEATRSKCGCLLRDWHEIAGRDQTPIRRVRADEKCELDQKICAETNKKTKRSVSPDLFCSDDEHLSEKANDSSNLELEEPREILSQSLMISPANKSTRKNDTSSDSESDCKIVESDNGIIHYESFRDNNESEVFECFDLTQSSSEDTPEKIPDDDSTQWSPPKTLKKYGSEGTLNITAVCGDEDDHQNVSLALENKRTSRKCLFKKYHSDLTPIKTIDKELKGADETFEKSLNVTDYILKILNKSNCDDFNEVATDETDGDACSSQDTIHYISDEELNYSSRMNQENTQLPPPVNVKGNTHTPDNSLLIKTTNVTPMINYNSLNTPEIHKHLQNYGLKPLKRRRGVEILNYIYETTHPVVNPNGVGKKLPQCDGDDDGRAVKKSKIVPEKRVCSASEQDWIFERKHSSKVVSCRVPLHIAWHNLVSNNPELHKNILTYEPLQLEVLHEMLKEQGYKYHIEDLVTFLDKKCITFCTNQSKGPNGRRRAKVKKKGQVNLSR